MSASLIALTVRPRIGLYTYIWYTLMRPDQLAYVSYANYFSFVLAACTILGGFRVAGPRLGVLFKSKLALGLILFVLMAVLCSATAIVPELAFDVFWGFVRSMAVLMFIPLVLETPEQLRTAFLVAAGSIGFLGLKFGVWGVIHGGAKVNVGLVNDNNFLALLLAIGVSMCWYSAPMIPRKMYRLAFYGAMFFTMAAVVLTYSRGGAVAMAVGLVMIGLRSKKKILVLPVLMVFLFPAIYLAGDAYRNRMSTIVDPMAEGSAASRFYLMKIGLNMWKDHPLFGVGFGRTNQQRLMAEYAPEVVAATNYNIKVIHNTYVQILADCGVLGFLIFVTLLGGAILSLQFSIRKTAPHLKPLPIGLQTALMTFAVGSFTISALPSFDAFFVLIALASSWQVVASEAQVEQSKPGPTVYNPVTSMAISR